MSLALNNTGANGTATGEAVKRERKENAHIFVWNLLFSPSANFILTCAKRREKAKNTHRPVRGKRKRGEDKYSFSVPKVELVKEFFPFVAGKRGENNTLSAASRDEPGRKTVLLMIISDDSKRKRVIVAAFPSFYDSSDCSRRYSSLFPTK